MTKTELPGDPAPAMKRLWESLTETERAALLPHLLGGTGADWIAFELTNAGKRIGATSIKNYRRTLRQAGV